MKDETETVQAQVNVLATDGLCGIWDVDRDAYYADKSRVSSHMMVDADTSVPLYHGLHVAATIPAPEPTGPMVLGSAFDCYLLEPEVFAERVRVAPPSMTRRQKAWDEFRADAYGRVSITAGEFADLKEWREGVLRNPHARAILEAAGRRQLTLRWQCPETGLPRKGMLDLLLDNGTVVDLKTAADPSPLEFNKAIANYKYHRQGATYLEAAWQALSADGPCAFIVIGKEPPYECVRYELDGAALELGHKENLQLATELAERYRTGNWSSRWADQVHMTNLPRWAYYAR